MKTLILIVALLMSSMPCQSESYDEYLVRINKESPKSKYTGQSVVAVLSGMVTPKMNAVYGLTYMQIIQKVSGGYLMMYSDPSKNEAICYLKTKNSYSPDYLFRSGKAELTGLYSYVALDGFEREVVAFKEVE